ncbi:low temperature requirement protein A [Nonomuraea glycinis]|uniref:Membrane protein n=1 Tax=Nonomuraea glycinis TaxID=2047744 RepID=A0A918A337_9ACTN|nr:low temperature requirement protein A [Nonomuraea glycinis]MCA2174591.1 low temperature requirement protein A [Nonomuraea glycinis]GGP02073.1 membrane protein [Nonomuraea glycinis]
MPAPPPPASRFRLIPMAARDPHEPGRSASMLELFFDLVFVVAVSIASIQLHHALTEGHVLDGLVTYGLVFFGIWWAWMNFTWFATSFDTDDWLYRVLTIVQMAGVLVLAAGIEPAFTDADYTLPILSYVVMRLAMVAQWLRASRSDASIRRTAQVYAGGIAAVQVLWLLQLTLPDVLGRITLVLLIVVEIAIPVIAQRRGTTPWHPHHITERYGLFTLILLGESLLASSNAIIEAVHDTDALGPLISIAALTFVVTAALWWIYFWPPHHRSITSFRESLRYGYVHYFVFAAAGAFSAGIEVQIDVLTGHSELSDLAASFAVTIPIAVFLAGIWWIAIRDHADPLVNAVVPLAAVLVLGDPLIPVPVTLTAVILVLVIVVLVLHPPVSSPTPPLPDATGAQPRPTIGRRSRR